MPKEKPALAWSSTENAIKFAFDLSAIRLNDDTNGKTMLSRRGPENVQISAVRRLGAVLNLIEKTGPVIFATLWKYRSRSGRLSAVARSQSYDPNVETKPYEFVCEPKDTHASLIIKNAKPIPNCERYEWLKYWYYEDIQKLEEDFKWNTKKLIQQGPDPTGSSRPLSRQLAIIFTGCSGRTKDEKYYPLTNEAPSNTEWEIDYILNLYLDKEVPFEEIDLETNENFRRYIKAISNKIASGVCALIEERKTLITEMMTHRGESTLRGNISEVLSTSLSPVIPNCINVEHSYLFLHNSSGRLDIALNDAFARSENDKIELKQLESQDFINNIIQRTSCPTSDSRYPDLHMIQLKKGDPLKILQPKFESLLLAKLSAHDDTSKVEGYLVLVNRSNDLAALCSHNSSYAIQEGFDWEDEEYLHHISGIVDFIIGIVSADQKKLLQAAYLGHEMKAPAQFIYETADRLRRDLDPHERSPYHSAGPQMKIREVQDVLDTSEFVERIADSIATAGDDPLAARATQYEVERVNLLNVARDMARISLPLCKKYRLDSRNIVIRSDLPSLYMDESAAYRILMNLIMNAAKYADHRNPNKFKLLISSEITTISSLLNSEPPPSNSIIFDNIKKYNIREGYLVTISDFGIGIQVDNEQRVFESGYREVGHVPAGVFGAGLGLYFVRKIMRDHFGEAWVVQRNNPTKFALFFPDVLFNKKYEEWPEWKKSNVS